MFPELITPRFILQQILSTDKIKVFEGLSHPEVIRYYGVSYATIEATQAQLDWYDQLLISKTGIWWGIRPVAHPSLIGACGFNNLNRDHQKAEIGFWLLPTHWKEGVMTEVLPIVIQYAFESLHLHRIEAVVESKNGASRNLLLKLNFEFEGRLRECEIKNGKYIDLDYYALLHRKLSL